MQIKAKGVRATPPDSADSLARLLGSGSFKGIGPVLAARLVEQVGALGAVNALEHGDIATLSRIRGISRRIAMAASEQWQTRATGAEFEGLCARVGLSVAATARLRQSLGGAGPAMEALKLDPYGALSRVKGSGLGLAVGDKIARAVEAMKTTGIDAGDQQGPDHGALHERESIPSPSPGDPLFPPRVKASILREARHTMMREGHCFLPASQLLTLCAKAVLPSAWRVRRRQPAVDRMIERGTDQEAGLVSVADLIPDRPVGLGGNQVAEDDAIRRVRAGFLLAAAEGNLCVSVGAGISGAGKLSQGTVLLDASCGRVRSLTASAEGLLAAIQEGTLHAEPMPNDTFRRHDETESLHESEADSEDSAVSLRGTRLAELATADAIGAMLRSFESTGRRLRSRGGASSISIDEALQESREHDEALLAPKEKPTDAVDAVTRDRHAALSDEQRAAVETALSSPVAVITGGPGTGKTTAVRAVVYAWLR